MFLAAASLLFSGLAQATISPPLGWILLHPVAWVPAFSVFARLSAGRALLAGLVVGTSANLAIFYWLPGTMTRFGGLPQPLSLSIWLLYAAAVGAYVGVFAYGFARVRRIAGARWPFAVAAWFCALEFLNPQLFGYLQGVAWYQVPHVFLASAWTGVSAISFLVVLCNALVLQGFELRDSTELRRASGLVLNVAVFAVLAITAVGLSTLRLQRIAEVERDAAPLRVALIQPNYTIERRREMEAMSADAFARDLVLQSQRAARHAVGKIDVFVWPEGALRADPAQPRNLDVLELVRESGAEVWTGASHHELRAPSERVSHNSAFRIYADGRVDRRYDKNILVPFGEYLPLAGVIPGLPRIDAIANFEAGEAVPVYVSGATRFVFLICYEAIRSGFVRRAVADRDANLIVNVTVDAWYGDSSEQSQHLMLAAVQSALHGIPLVRATTTGISAFVDARGVITARTGTYTREALIREVRPLRIGSWYSRYGDWFAWLCVMASAALLAASRRRRA